MTHMSDPSNTFLVFGNTKTEIERSLMEAFTAACVELGVKRTDVLRHLVWEFVQEVRNKSTEKDIDNE